MVAIKWRRCRRSMRSVQFTPEMRQIRYPSGFGQLCYDAGPPMPGSSAARNTPEAGKRSRRHPAPAISAAGVRPLLKWAGGKRQLLRELSRFVHDSFSGYHEPFLGSGAMFFELWRRNRLGAGPCRLSDINADLVGCYRALTYDADGVIRELQMLAARHAAEGA